MLDILLSYARDDEPKARLLATRPDADTMRTCVHGAA